MFGRLLRSRNGHNEPVMDPADYARLVAERDYYKSLAEIRLEDTHDLARILQTFDQSAPWYAGASLKVKMQEICARLLWFCEEPVRATTNGGW